MSARFMESARPATGLLVIVLLVFGPSARAEDAASAGDKDAAAAKPGIAAALAYRLKAEQAADDPFAEPGRDSTPVAPSLGQKIRERAESRARVGTRRSAEDHIRAALENPTSLDFIETPLREVMEYLADLHHIPIFIDETALNDEGIASDTPVNITVENVTLCSALHLLLRELNLQYEFADEVLMITSKAGAESLAEVRIHPVGDLLTCAGGGKPDVASLAGVVMAAVCPEDQWTEWPTGGWKAGRHGQLTIVPFGDTLVVRHCWSTQEEIEALLARLREATAKKK